MAYIENLMVLKTVKKNLLVKNILLPEYKLFKNNF